MLELLSKAKTGGYVFPRWSLLLQESVVPTRRTTRRVKSVVAQSRPPSRAAGLDT